MFHGWKTNGSIVSLEGDCKAEITPADLFISRAVRFWDGRGLQPLINGVASAPSLRRFWRQGFDSPRNCAREVAQQHAVVPLLSADRSPTLSA